MIDWIYKPFDDERLQQALESVRKQMKPACVLLVEGDESIREVLKNHLESMGATYIESVDAAETIKNYNEYKPDLVIMDMMQPESAMQIVDRLNEESKGLLPIIIYSSLDLTADQEAQITNKLVAYLMKSVTSEEKLVTTIRSFLSGLLLSLPARSDHEKVGAELSDSKAE